MTCVSSQENKYNYIVKSSNKYRIILCFDIQGGNNMRGDQKWPPAPVKSQMEHENEMRKQLAKGPACRPRKVKKDYSSFFAQHALNSTYPGYRAPPGTQYYEPETSGVTNF